MSDNSIDQLDFPSDFTSYEFYEDFCEYTDVRLTYQEFRDLMEVLKSERDKSLLNFKPPGNLGGILAATIPVLTSAAGSAADATIDDLLNKSEQTIRRQAQKMRDRFASRVSETIGISGIGKGGDGGTTTADYSGGSAYNPTGLSLNLKPVSSSFTTGVVPLYRPKYFDDGTESGAPVILKCVNIFPEYAVSRFMGQDSLNRYFENAMTSAYVNSISTRLKPNSFTSGVAGNRPYLCSYFMILGYALATYYSHASIIAHFRMQGNRNEGMIELYRSLSVDDLNQIGILGQILDGIPIPPRLNEFMFQVYGNYKQSFLPGSPLTKVIPFTFQSPGNTKKRFTVMGDTIPAILDMLKTKPFRDVQQVFASAYPEMVNTTVMAYDGSPDFDANWNSFFVNLPYYGATSTMSKIVPQVTSEDDKVQLNLHTDSPDGWIEFASGIYNVTTDQYNAGLGAPKALVIGAGANPLAVSTDLFSDYGRTSGGVIGSTSAFIYRRDTDWDNNEYDAFWPLSAREENQIISGNTYKIHHGTPMTNSFQRYGTEIATPRTARDSAVTTQQLIDFFYFPISMTPKTYTPKATAGEAMESEGSKRRPRSRRRRK